MTVRLRYLAAAVPLFAATLLVAAPRCADATHALLYSVGVVHAESACASGTALGPSAFHLAGIVTLLLLGIVANSAAVQDAIGALVDVITQRITPMVVPVPVRVTDSYSMRFTWGAIRKSGSRDPPME